MSNEERIAGLESRIVALESAVSELRGRVLPVLIMAAGGLALLVWGVYAAIRG
jgi:hypothetical protein